MRGQRASRQQAERRAAVLVRQQLRRPGPGRASSGAGWPARQSPARRPSGAMSTVQSVAKISSSARSCSRTCWSVRQQLVAAEAREGQRAPGDAQLHAERRLVGAVPADVADHRVHRAVGGADGVVEVAAEQGAAAAGAVAGGEAQRGALQQRGGQQAALQPGVLLGAQPGLGELALGEVGAFALDRVADRAAAAAGRRARRGRGGPGRRRVPPRRRARRRRTR